MSKCLNLDLDLDLDNTALHIQLLSIGYSGIHNLWRSIVIGLRMRLNAVDLESMTDLPVLIMANYYPIYLHYNYDLHYVSISFNFSANSSRKAE